MAAMAVSRPSARPHDGCHTAVAAIWPEDGCREFDPAFSPPRHEPRWLHSRSASHHTLFWMAGVVISQPSRWNAWSGSSKLSHPPADGCDGCMTAILRPGGWLGHSHRSHRPEDGCTGWKAAKMARAGRRSGQDALRFPMPVSGGKPRPPPRAPGKAQVWPRASEGTKRSPV